jgi:hypothetical protein
MVLTNPPIVEIFAAKAHSCATGAQGHLKPCLVVSPATADTVTAANLEPVRARLRTCVTAPAGAHRKSASGGRFVFAVIAMDRPLVAFHERVFAQTDQHLMASVRRRKAQQLELGARKVDS